MSRCLINFIDIEQVPGFPSDKAQMLIDAACADDDLNQQQINVLFVNKEDSAALHQEHFDDPLETDVMSFPDNSEDPESGLMHVGDLAVCFDVAAQVAKKRNVPLHDELLLYILHGFLHLLGYDDIEESDRQEMWNLQQKYMQLIDVDIGSMP